MAFESIGGLEQNIKILKEVLLIPLTNMAIYTKYCVQPPRGVLFHGPPGTGKTLVAKSLANELTEHIGRTMTFINCKGSDILDKYFGESEKKLKELFAQAAKKSPSIIFIDEIDGLAPIRSARHDQAHVSIVTTLLTLMDGLDKLSGVVVIGATNRLEALDPALRRPGRFDRELYFPLPAFEARQKILQVHVNNWPKKPSPEFLAHLADITPGYSGADLQALCTEAVMSSLRRNYPDIHDMNPSRIRMRTLQVEECDFITARKSITPTSNYTAIVRRLPELVRPLLQNHLKQTIKAIKIKWPHFMNPKYKYHDMGDMRYAGRLVLVGGPTQGHASHLAPAILHALEHLQPFVIDIQAMHESSYHPADEMLVQRFNMAKQNVPSILLLSKLNEWWHIVEERTRVILISLLESIHASIPLLLVATLTDTVPDVLLKYFTRNDSVVVNMTDPTLEERKRFLYPLFYKAYKKCAQFTQTKTVSDQTENETQHVSQVAVEPDIATSDTKVDNCKSNHLIKTKSSHSNKREKKKSSSKRKLETTSNDNKIKRAKYEKDNEFNKSEELAAVDIRKRKQNKSRTDNKKGHSKSKRYAIVNDCTEIKTPDAPILSTSDTNDNTTDNTLEQTSKEEQISEKSTAQTESNDVQEEESPLKNNPDSSKVDEEICQCVDVNPENDVPTLAETPAVNRASSTESDGGKRKNKGKKLSWRSSFNKLIENMSRTTSNSILKQKSHRSDTLLEDTSVHYSNENFRANECEPSSSTEPSPCLPPHERVAQLFDQALTTTTSKMTVEHLELLQDRLVDCIKRKKHGAPTMLQNMEKIMNGFEEALK